MTETRVALLAIIVKDNTCAEAVNALLHDANRWIIGRMGIPHRSRGIGIISIALEAPQDEISALSGKIGRLPGVSVKTVYAPV